MDLHLSYNNNSELGNHQFILINVAVSLYCHNSFSLLIDVVHLSIVIIIVCHGCSIYSSSIVIIIIIIINHQS